MKLIDEMDAQKLRGGFYTPPPVVDACWDRIQELMNGTKAIRVLEPSAGDGAFVRGLARLRTTSRLRRGEVVCVELVESEAARCRDELERSGVSGEVVAGSFFRWLEQERGTFNVFVGNPPFIRYQFVPDAERLSAELLLRTRGHELQGVSNYWIPFVLLGLDSLTPGGVFSLVLPSELLSTVSAGQVRSELIRKFDSLHVDLYPRKTFPDILQDVLILSGVRTKDESTSRIVHFSEHASSGAREWNHRIGTSGESWTKFLLTISEWEAFEAARRLPQFKPFRELATVSVAIVTGANDYFTVDDSTMRAHKLQSWARPLLARTADSPGIIFNARDHAAALAAGKKCWLLDFSEDRPDPMLDAAPAAYIRAGRLEGLHTRYKTSIREPWYRVPHIQRGAVMMAKRSHQHHRLILNEAAVYTTDTIYRGDIVDTYRGRESDLVAMFHNSVTMLSAEIEGRTYGGGVLELVPSEICRLSVPMVVSGKSLRALDEVSRSTGGQRDTEDRLINATDEMLGKYIAGFNGVLPAIATARNRLRDRRFFG